METNASLQKLTKQINELAIHAVADKAALREELASVVQHLEKIQSTCEALTTALEQERAAKAVLSEQLQVLTHKSVEQAAEIERLSREAFHLRQEIDEKTTNF